MKPIIGINLDVTSGSPPQASIQTTYYEAIQKAGGIPVLLPPMSDEDLDAVLRSLNGVLLIGGLDYCPSKYGEEASELVEVCDKQREEFDFRLIDRTLHQTNLPILGICAGAQLLNISLGGSLIQDINCELPDTNVVHTINKGWQADPHKHPVNLQLSSQLGRIYKSDRLNVPTSHHQSVKQLGKGLVAVAHADDGIIEAIELEDRPFIIGVQWHPERDFAGNIDLFQHFIQAASQGTISQATSAAMK
ncbi:MAG: gamma-glutamyl-gamma-aminobutyrate hydrolase family protein [Cyanobacteria bacterium SZAS-4]|nr:gamma-glutamyl-gamma-aminobutyrate hydrolase family protein [Cyanobacteria bacterium SZAS-4]